MILIQIIEGKEGKNRSEDISGFDRDEFPYATTKEGGKGAAVNYVPSSENRSHGANLGSFIRVKN